MSKFLKLASCAAAAFVCFAPAAATAGITGSGTTYTLDCSDGLVSEFNVPANQTITVTIENCHYWLASGSGMSQTGSGYIGLAPYVITVSPGAIGRVRGYNAGQPPAGAEAQLNLVAPPPAPVPTMSEWAMILFAVAMAGAAAIVIQKRRTA